MSISVKNHRNSIANAPESQQGPPRPGSIQLARIAGTEKFRRMRDLKRFEQHKIAPPPPELPDQLAFQQAATTPPEHHASPSWLSQKARALGGQIFTDAAGAAILGATSIAIALRYCDPLLAPLGVNVIPALVPALNVIVVAGQCYDAMATAGALGGLKKAYKDSKKQHAKLLRELAHWRCAIAVYDQTHSLPKELEGISADLLKDMITLAEYCRTQLESSLAGYENNNMSEGQKNVLTAARKSQNLLIDLKVDKSRLECLTQEGIKTDDGMPVERSLKVVNRQIELHECLAIPVAFGKRLMPGEVNLGQKMEAVKTLLASQINLDRVAMASTESTRAGVQSGARIQPMSENSIIIREALDTLQGGFEKSILINPPHHQIKKRRDKYIEPLEAPPRVLLACSQAATNWFGATLPLAASLGVASTMGMVLAPLFIVQGIYDYQDAPRELRKAGDEKRRLRNQISHLEQACIRFRAEGDTVSFGVNMAILADLHRQERVQHDKTMQAKVRRGWGISNFAVNGPTLAVLTVVGVVLTLLSIASAGIVLKVAGVFAALCGTHYTATLAYRFARGWRASKGAERKQEAARNFIRKHGREGIEKLHLNEIEDFKVSLFDSKKKAKTQALQSLKRNKYLAVARIAQQLHVHAYSNTLKDPRAFANLCRSVPSIPPELIAELLLCRIKFLAPEEHLQYVEERLLAHRNYENNPDNIAKVAKRVDSIAMKRNFDENAYAYAQAKKTKELGSLLDALRKDLGAEGLGPNALKEVQRHLLTTLPRGAVSTLKQQQDEERIWVKFNLLELLINPDLLNPDLKSDEQAGGRLEQANNADDIAKAEKVNKIAMPPLLEEEESPHDSSIDRLISTCRKVVDKMPYDSRQVLSSEQRTNVHNQFRKRLLENGLQDRDLEKIRHHYFQRLADPSVDNKEKLLIHAHAHVLTTLLDARVPKTGLPESASGRSRRENIDKFFDVLRRKLEKGEPIHEDTLERLNASRLKRKTDMFDLTISHVGRRLRELSQKSGSATLGERRELTWLLTDTRARLQKAGLVAADLEEICDHLATAGTEQQENVMLLKQLITHEPTQLPGLALLKDAIRSEGKERSFKVRRWIAGNPLAKPGRVMDQVRNGHHDLLNGILNKLNVALKESGDESVSTTNIDLTPDLASFLDRLADGTQTSIEALDGYSWRHLNLHRAAEKTKAYRELIEALRRDLKLRTGAGVGAAAAAA